MLYKMPKIAIVVLFDKTLKNVILQYIPNWIRLSVIITHPPAAAGSSDIVAKSTYFLRNVPYKRFPKQGAKKLCPFRFSLCVCYLCLKIETHSRLQSFLGLCAKLQGFVIIHYAGLTCLIISIFLPILNTHFVQIL